MTASSVRRDFDHIAAVTGESGDGTRYTGWLMSQLPAAFDRALDAGCGTGELSRKLAGRAREVTGLDLSPAMIALARERAAALPNAEFEVANLLADDLGAGRYDVIASVATLHHMPLREILPRLAAALKPGGTMVIVDLLDCTGLRELPRNGVAWLVDRAQRLARSEPPLSAEAQRAWDQHFARDRFDSWSTLRRVYAELLPGTQLRRHLLWRYSAVWQKPAVSGVTDRISPASVG